MPLPDVLPIVPFTRPLRGQVVLPGSKSLTNRALLLAALSEREVMLTGALFSEDTELMSNGLRALGFEVIANEAKNTICVKNQAKAFFAAAPDKPVSLFVGLAGTTARFLTALCAAAPHGIYEIDGVPQMRKRPISELLGALRKLGAEIECLGEDGCFPIRIKAAGLKGGSIEMDASASSQLLSALLMVAPRATGPVQVRITSTVRQTFVDMTCRLMKMFGVAVDIDAATHRYQVEPAKYKAPSTYEIEPDATAASYFQALPLVTGGTLELPGLRSAQAGLQGDAAFAEVIKRTAARIPNTRQEEDFHEISDTFLTLAAISPLLSGETRITGIAHTRKQETDRVAGAARELSRLGQTVLEEEGALTITPGPLPTDVTIETYGDHRFAMSFAILGCHNLNGDGKPWLKIKNPACCAKTFPHFFELLESLRQKSLAG